jgi:hypothetical protein
VQSSQNNSRKRLQRIGIHAEKFSHGALPKLHDV